MLAHVLAVLCKSDSFRHEMEPESLALALEVKSIVNIADFIKYFSDKYRFNCILSFVLLL